MSYYSAFRDSPSRVEQFSAGGSDLPQLLELQMKQKIDSWAIRFCFAHYQNSAYCVHPRTTLVHNMGLDGSGTHSRPERRFEHEDRFNRWSPGDEDRNIEPNQFIVEQVRRFYDGRTGPIGNRLRGLLLRSRLFHIILNLVYRAEKKK